MASKKYTGKNSLGNKEDFMYPWKPFQNERFVTSRAVAGRFCLDVLLVPVPNSEVPDTYLAKVVIGLCPIATQGAYDSRVAAQHGAEEIFEAFILEHCGVMHKTKFKRHSREIC